MKNIENQNNFSNIKESDLSNINGGYTPIVGTGVGSNFGLGIYIAGAIASFGIGVYNGYRDAAKG